MQIDSMMGVLVGPLLFYWIMIIDSEYVVTEMIDVRDGSVKCELFNIDDVEFIINDLCIN